MELVPFIEKIKNDLKIDIVSSDLDGIYSEVKAYIIKIHPDKYTDEDVKEENNEKATVATSILTELKKEIDRKRATETALVPYDENKISIENYEYRLLVKENELFKLRKCILDKNNEIEKLKAEIDEIKKISEQVRSSQILEQKNEIIKTFKPQRTSFVTAGTVTALIVFYNILNQIEVVSKKLTSYLPISEKTTNIILFSALVLSICVIIYKSLKSFVVKNYLNTIITQNNIAEIGNLIEKGQINRQQLHDHILQKFKKEKWLKKMSNWFFGIKNPIIVEEAINMIVDYMIANSYIEKINVKNMIQNYKVLELTIWDVFMKSRESDEE
jgi:hypothetical protein